MDRYPQRIFQIFQSSSSEQLLTIIPASLILFIFRVSVRRLFIQPFGIYLGLKPGKSRANLQMNIPLEKAYGECGKWPHSRVVALSKEVDLTPRQVERWLRYRKGYIRPTKLTKFCESSERFLWYSLLWTYGLIVLWDKPWFWDINQSWTDFDNFEVPFDAWWYGYLTLSYYVSDSISQSMRWKRKDFWDMLIHHVIVVTMMVTIVYFSLHRIGTICCFLHDTSDVFLELGKSMSYLNYEKSANVVFVSFVMTWTVTRLYLFPFWFIKNNLEDKTGVLSKMSIYYTWNGFLLLLLCLHCFWSYLIVKILLKLLRSGVAKDMESETSSSEDLKDS